MATALEALDRINCLRRIALLFLDRGVPDAAWFADCLALYERGARNGLSIDFAFGFTDDPLTDSYKKRHKRRPSGPRGRAVAANAEYEPISKIAVFERDKWRCQNCGRETPRSSMGSKEPNAPELDHWIPLALGGHHIWENVCCLCRRCNHKKGASPPPCEWRFSRPSLLGGNDGNPSE
jgi:hypothetical protein